MRVLEDVLELEELKSKHKYALFYFTGPDCGVCSAVLPKLAEFLEDYQEVASIQIELEKFMILSGEYDVFTVPVLILFREGKEVYRQGRFINFQELEDKFSSLAFDIKGE